MTTLKLADALKYLVENPGKELECADYEPPRRNRFSKEKGGTYRFEEFVSGDWVPVPWWGQDETFTLPEPPAPAEKTELHNACARVSAFIAHYVAFPVPVNEVAIETALRELAAAIQARGGR